MTLRERNLIIEQLQTLKNMLKVYERCDLVGIEQAQHAIEIMKRQPLSSPGLPVSAGGDPEEPRYCSECGEPVLENQLTCSKWECAESFRQGLKTYHMYPPGWPKCPSCGKPALDGHITCGLAACNEGKWRDVWSH